LLKIKHVAEGTADFELHLLSCLVWFSQSDGTEKNQGEPKQLTQDDTLTSCILDRKVSSAYKRLYLEKAKTEEFFVL
jgi:hypothetical protein